MRAITIQQPWAWAIIHGGKNIENRAWSTSYRGRLAIHAGSRWSERGENSSAVRQAMRRTGPVDPGALPTGVIIGTVELVDVHPDAQCCRPWGETEYHSIGKQLHHFVLADPRVCTPIEIRGRQSLWTVPANLIIE